MPSCRPLLCCTPITCPAMGFLQAPQTPLATVATPSLFRSDCRLPSMLSSWLPGLGGPPGGELLPVFPWAMNYGERGQVRTPRAWGRCLIAPWHRGLFSRWADGPMEAKRATSSRGLKSPSWESADILGGQRDSQHPTGLTEVQETRQAGC